VTKGRGFRVPPTILKKEKAMKLSIKERFGLRQVYPQQSNLVNQVMVRDISKKVELTQTEMKKHDVKQKTASDGSVNIVWDDSNERPRGFTFTDAEVTFLKEQVERLNKANQISQDILNLCEVINGREDSADEENEDKPKMVS